MEFKTCFFNINTRLKISKSIHVAVTYKTVLCSFSLLFVFMLSCFLPLIHVQNQTRPLLQPLQTILTRVHLDSWVCNLALCNICKIYDPIERRFYKYFKPLSFQFVGLPSDNLLHMFILSYFSFTKLKSFYCTQLYWSFSFVLWTKWEVLYIVHCTLYLVLFSFGTKWECLCSVGFLLQTKWENIYSVIFLIKWENNYTTKLTFF